MHIGLGANIDRFDETRATTAEWISNDPAGPMVLCPGDPSCPGYVPPDVNTAVNAALAAQQAEAAAAVLAAQQQGAKNTGGQVKAPGQWVAGVSNSTVLIAGAVIAGAMFLGGRRK